MAAQISQFLSWVLLMGLAIVVALSLWYFWNHLPSSTKRVRGLSHSDLKGLSTMVFQSHKDEEDPEECAVCLGSFSPGDMCRLMPLCSHYFHVSCADQWLRRHSTCPLCRCSVVLLKKKHYDYILPIHTH